MIRRFVARTHKLGILGAFFATDEEVIMPTVMLMEWPGVSESQYSDVMKALDLDQNPPAAVSSMLRFFRRQSPRLG